MHLTRPTVLVFLMALLTLPCGGAVRHGSAATPAQNKASSWSFYMPQSERKAAIKRAYRRSVVKKNFAEGIGLDTIWVTRDVARAFVSRMVDEERLAVEDADARFAALRPSDRYLVHVRVSAHAGGLEFRAKSLFLQRVGYVDHFTRGEVVDDLVFDSGITVSTNDISHVLAFPRVTDNGVPLIVGLDESVELSLQTQYSKPGVVRYDLRQLVSAVSEL